MSRLLLSVTLGASACIGWPPTGTDIGYTTVDESDACALAADSQVCPDCTDGPLTCSFGETSVTVGSCGECQSRATLYQALCDAGETADRATIEADTTCAAPTCVVWTDNCTDPCAPLCVREDEILPDTTTCDIACADTALPDPGVCAWTGTECAFE